MKRVRESWNECEREKRREIRRLKQERNASWLIVAGLVGYMAARRI